MSLPRVHLNPVLCRPYTTRLPCKNVDDNDAEIICFIAVLRHVYRGTLMDEATQSGTENNATTQTVVSSDSPVRRKASTFACIYLRVVVFRRENAAGQEDSQVLNV